RRAAAKPGKRPRKRARRRPASAGDAAGPAAEPAPHEQQARAAQQRAGAARQQARAARRVALADRDPGGFGERPQAPWHPFPLAELLILIGLIAVAIGAARGEAGRNLLLAGIGAVVLGTLEFTVREHPSGYRAHSSLLA